MSVRASRRWRAIIIVTALLHSVAQCAPLHLSNRGLNAAPGSRFAYVTIHYEGTSRDQEYVLGIQVLMQSIKLSGSHHDVVVLASESVSEASVSLFNRIGCRVLHVENIANPFLNHTLQNHNFIYTLNKIHIWSLTEYERVVYVDADNIIVRNADELFLCGPLCAVFMNPCHFHTGLLVVTPDLEEYHMLLHNLKSADSFDGADQGFFSSIYSRELRKAPLFNPFRSRSAPFQEDQIGMRLPVGYNINHKYFYEQYHWRLYYLRHFATMTSPVSPVKVVVESARPIPAITVGFPMAPLLKPWYWWAAFILDLHHVWHDVRATIPANLEQYGFEVASTSFLRFLFGIVMASVVLFVLKAIVPIHNLQQKFVRIALKNDAYVHVMLLTFRLLLVASAAWFAPIGIHRLSPVHYGFTMMIIRNVSLLVFFACVISKFWAAANDRALPRILCITQFWIYVFITFAVEFGIVWASTWQLFPTILIRMLFLAILLVFCGIWQVHFFKLSYEVEFRGKKERLRSL